MDQRPPLALVEKGAQQEALQHVLKMQRDFGICPLSSRNALCIDLPLLRASARVLSLCS